METHKINIAGTETTITTPDGFGAMMHAAFAAELGYQATIPDPDNEGEEIDNPQSVEQFTATKIVDYCRAIVASHNHKQARTQTAAQVTAANDNLASQITIE